jgi:hypothetical protein
LGATSSRHRFIPTPSAKINKGQRLLEIGAPKGAPYGAKRIAEIVNDEPNHLERLQAALFLP